MWPPNLQSRLSKPHFFFQESEGSDGESEYDDGANNEQDELISEDELEQEAVSDRVMYGSPPKCIRAHFLRVRVGVGCHR